MIYYFIGFCVWLAIACIFTYYNVDKDFREEKWYDAFIIFPIAAILYPCYWIYSLYGMIARPSGNRSGIVESITTNYDTGETGVVINGNKYHCLYWGDENWSVGDKVEFVKWWEPLPDYKYRMRARSIYKIN